MLRLGVEPLWSYQDLRNDSGGVRTHALTEWLKNQECWLRKMLRLGVEPLLSYQDLRHDSGGGSNPCPYGMALSHCLRPLGHTVHVMQARCASVICAIPML